MQNILLNNNLIPVNNIFCIARSYAENLEELGKVRNSSPVVFLKPKSALHFGDSPVKLPHNSNEIYYEAELVIVLGKGGKNLSSKEALDCIAGYSIGLDLTAKDWQTDARKQGLPWALAKGFDGSACVIREFIPVGKFPDPTKITFDMYLNGQLRQHGDTSFLLYSLADIISFLSHYFTLECGDLIYTGTPPGAGLLSANDRISLHLGEQCGEFLMAC